MWAARLTSAARCAWTAAGAGSQPLLSRPSSRLLSSASVNGAFRRFPRYATTAAATSTIAPACQQLSHPIVGKWMLFSSSLVFGIVVVGGITRLTESGLSITEWNLVRGMKWPSSQEEWDAEFNKYKQTPEYVLLNHSMSLKEFKSIFYWEWFHRNLGRTIGMVFLLPTIYFTATRPSAQRIAKALAGSSHATKESLSQWMTPRVRKSAWVCCGLVGFQGALGWYMVKSGLNQDLLSTPNATPRVSQYRLASHLGSAFLIYIASLWTGMQVLQDYRFAVKANGVSSEATFVQQLGAVDRIRFLRFGKGTHWLASLVFITAMSGAFVAGLDAGLVYNTWPLMGDNFVPPRHELFPPIVSSSSNGQAVTAPLSADENEQGGALSLFSQNRWKNVFENPVTVQFDHRMLAYTTFGAVSGMWIVSRRLPLPPSVRQASSIVMAAALAQATLGITTLIYFVPLELAASHQAGSLALLTSVLWLMHRVRACAPKRILR
ncbi:Cytochrome c oxidase assembly protein cox15 [Sorochytrium milnesiophthora]